tara:strand:+ start:185 stop:400 length:216 start_codon:yes stop_codon:yes gene_type:complete
MLMPTDQRWYFLNAVNFSRIKIRMTCYYKFARSLTVPFIFIVVELDLIREMANQNETLLSYIMEKNGSSCL